MGADQETADLVAQALAAIRSVLEPQHVVLFGSRARRTHSEQSDLDLLIVGPITVPGWVDSPCHLVGRAHCEGQFIA